MRAAFIQSFLFVSLLVSSGGAALAAETAAPVSHLDDPLARSGTARFYNMDYDGAVRDLEKALERHADDPFAVNHLAMAVLIRELYRMGALNSGDYANDSFIGKPSRPASAEAKHKVSGLLDRARQLEEKRLEANGHDIDALYARGATRALAATYTGLIERAWISALRSAVGSRKDHERVLELDPDYADAKLVVGTHDYVVGSLPWAVKAAVAVVGFSGNRERGISELCVAAKSGRETPVDAKILLALFLRREHRYDEALNIVRELTQLYPQNLLMAIEEGNVLRVAGRTGDSAAAYRKVWESGRKGQYPHGHLEVAAIGLGDLLRSQKDYSGAALAYSLVDEITNPDPDLRQQADLAAGEVYDLLHQRPQAVKKYEAVVALDGGNDRASVARDRLKEPYRE